MRESSTNADRHRGDFRRGHRRRPSGVLQTVVNGGSPSTLSSLALAGGAASEGGFPIVMDGKPIGAIGASGGTFSPDGVAAEAGLEAKRASKRRMGSKGKSNERAEVTKRLE